MLRCLQTSPTSSPKFERSYSCVDGLCIPCFWTLVSMQQVSLCLEGSLHSLFGFDPAAPVSWRLEEPSLVDSLENFRLPIWNQRASSFLVPGRLFFFHRHSPDRFEIPNLMRKFPPCIGCASPDSQVLLLLSERESFWNGYKNTDTEGDSIHFSRNFLWSECQRVGFWCQHIWFGFWVPNWFCQTTSQEQLCGFWTHVSSADLVLQLSFRSRLRCRQRCKTEIHLEKNVWWCVRNPLRSTAHYFVFFWHVGSWFRNQALPQFLCG